VNRCRGLPVVLGHAAGARGAQRPVAVGVELCELAVAVDGVGTVEVDVLVVGRRPPRRSVPAPPAETLAKINPWPLPGLPWPHLHRVPWPSIFFGHGAGFPVSAGVGEGWPGVFWFITKWLGDLVHGQPGVAGPSGLAGVEGKQGNGVPARPCAASARSMISSSLMGSRSWRGGSKRMSMRTAPRVPSAAACR